MKAFVTELFSNTIIRLVIISVIMDTFFGVGRAIKERTFNSSVGIDGAIRKIAMIFSILFLCGIDKLVGWNLIAFIPEQIRNYFPASLVVIGLAEFFGLLYLAYECVSILKNMTLCGLPVKFLWQKVRNFLLTYTDELPDCEDKESETLEFKEVNRVE